MISLDKYAKKYGDIPYPENISEKQAKKYVETYVKLGRSRGRAKGEVLKNIRRPYQDLESPVMSSPKTSSYLQNTTHHTYTRNPLNPTHKQAMFIRVYMHVASRSGLKQSRHYRHRLTFMS